MRAALSGRFPLVFSDADESGRSGSTTWEVTPPTGTNIISFPDTSGTVVTTGNLPSTIVMGDEDYALQARALVASVRAAAFGCDAAEIHDGSFVFADASSCDPPAGLGAAARTPGAFRSRGANSFNVRALGGAKIVTGHTASGRELGVALAPGASGWSVLSDAASKANVSRVDPRARSRHARDASPARVRARRPRRRAVQFSRVIVSSRESRRSRAAPTPRAARARDRPVRRRDRPL